MSLKIGIQVQVVDMEGTEIVGISKIDTAINPNPNDLTVEAVLAAAMVGRMAEEAAFAAQERLGEYNQALARLSP